MIVNTKNPQMLPPLPWHIHTEKASSSEERKGRLIHVEEPKFECRFYIGNQSIQTKGLSTLNTDTNVLLYDVVLPKDQNIASNLKEINEWMKEGSRFIYDMLYLPYFRKQERK